MDDEAYYLLQIINHFHGPNKKELNLLPQEEHRAKHGALPGTKGLYPNCRVHENGT